MTLPSWTKSSVTNWAWRILLNSLACPSRWPWFMSAFLKETTCCSSSSTLRMMMIMKKLVLTHLPLKSSRIDPSPRMINLRWSPRGPLPSPLPISKILGELLEELRKPERCPVLVTFFGWNMRYARNSISNGQVNWWLTNQLITPRLAGVSLQQTFFEATASLLRTSHDLAADCQPESEALSA